MLSCSSCTSRLSFLSSGAIPVADTRATKHLRVDMHHVAFIGGLGVIGSFGYTLSGGKFVAFDEKVVTQYRNSIIRYKLVKKSSG